ncbi:MAG: methionyl-tRNA formyltransferase [Dehalococcoidia bacterium]
MRIALIGQSDFGKDVLDALIKDQKNIVGVFCPPDSKEGQFDPIKESAQSHKIDLYQFGRLRNADPITTFLSLNVDLCVMAFVTDIVPMEIINSPNLGTIQYHPSLLPLHRGPSSMNWPIIAGKKETGLSIFWPDDGLDTGPILLQKKVDIDDTDTLGTLYFKKLYPMGVDALVEAVNLVSNNNAPKIDQDHSAATYEGWCKSENARIDWSKPAIEIYNLIRGCDPSPGANTTLNSQKISFYKSHLSSEISEMPYGTITSINQNSFSVSANEGSLTIERVKLAGNSKQYVADFLKTTDIKIGDNFR